MFKILLITLITSFFSLQAEEVKTEKRNLCKAKAYEILERGLAPCKAGDILITKEVWNEGKDREHMLMICVLGTIGGDTCILKKEEDFGERIEH